MRDQGMLAMVYVYYFQIFTLICSFPGTLILKLDQHVESEAPSPHTTLSIAVQVSRCLQYWSIFLRRLEPCFSWTYLHN